VTIGIAAKSYNARYIVMASDLEVSFGDVIPAAENAMIKEFYVGSLRCALFDGNDIGSASSLLMGSGNT
jgi:hypothetical protein